MKEKGCSFYMAKHSTEFKLKVLKYYEKYGIEDTLRVYNISKLSVYRWIERYESGDFMRNKKMTYTVEEKLEIIDFYRKNGIKETLDRYHISTATAYKWERILVEYGVEALGEDGRKRSKVTKKDVNQDKDLLEENQRLRIENMYLKKLRALVKERKEQENKKK